MITADEVGAELLDRARKRMANPGYVWGIPWGFPGLDKLTGGIHRGQLAVAMGRPSVGKTTFAADIVQSVANYILAQRAESRWWERKVVRVVSLEMAPEEWQQMMACARAKLESEKVRTGFISAAEFRRYEAAMTEVRALPIEYMTEASSLQEIIRALKDEGRCVFWVVDHLGIVPGVVMSADRTGQISQAIEAFRLLAKHHAPGLVLSQMSRACETRQDKRPMMSDLYGSVYIEAAAHVVIGLYRDDLYVKLSDDQRSKPLPAEVSILKNRNGGTGVINFIFAHQLPRWLDTSEALEKLAAKMLKG